MSKTLNMLKLILRNLTYYKKKQINVILGVALGAAILIGALIIGDSVRYSLQRIVYKRLGKIQYSMTSGDRVFRRQLADDISGISKVNTSAVLHSKGVLISGGGQARLNNIQFYGVDQNFDNLSLVPGMYRNLAPNEIVVNSYAASKLSLSAGDEVLLRFEKLDNMPKDSPLADDSEITVAERFLVKSIADDDNFGRFGLKSEQIAPFNVFLTIDKLSSLMEMDNSANMLLVAAYPDETITLDEINASLSAVWQLEDSGLKLLVIEDQRQVELRSKRIFIDEPVIDAARKTGIDHHEILTYFVNEIGTEKNVTPYSFVAAAGSEILNVDLADNEIIINKWTANDLNAGVGSELKLKYFTVGDNKNLSVDSSNFIIKKIVGMKGIYSDQDFLPDYPGLSGTESCMDWHPGIPIDFDKIRKKDEIYWEKFKGTPKAFITLSKAKQIWQNRFGEITAIRFDTDDLSTLGQNLNSNINPLSWNIQFTDSRKDGLEASEHSVDFGGLFIGLSFFVIVAALLLTGMLFHFNLDSRSSETGLFMGLGFKNSLIKRIVFTEAGILILAGSLLGCIAGVFYNNLILLALGSVWSDAVGTSSLEISIRPATVATGFVIAVVLNFLVIWMNVRKTISQNIHSLQRGITKLDYFRTGKGKKYLVISTVSVLSAIMILFKHEPGAGSEAFGTYFTVGTLILISGITFAVFLIGKFGKTVSGKEFNLADLALKEITRKKSRSILLVTLLGSSLFIVFTVGINKKVVDENSLSNKSGTGGYSLFGESSVPVYKDLNNPDFRKALGIDQYVSDELRFVQMKVKSGDDASCLNLNRVKNPQILGVNTKIFLEREAFTFVSFIPEVDQNNPWSILDKNISDNFLYGIADASVIQWQLGKSIGDTLMYSDDKGNEFGVILAAGLENSIFQGNLLISESNFVNKFPFISGSRIFLAESSAKNLNEIYRQLNFTMQDYGLNLSYTHKRLAEFNKIENTYLSIFLILGSFGILIGSLGIGIVVYRNVAEQSREYALLQAVGYKLKQINKIINSAYMSILFYGMFTGIAAAVAGSLPSLMYSNSEIPWLMIFTIIFMIVISCLVSIFVSTGKSLKGNVAQLLRNE